MSIQKALLVAHILSFSIFIGIVFSNIVVRCLAERRLDSASLQSVLEMLLVIELKIIPFMVGTITISGIALIALNLEILKQMWFILILMLWVSGAILANALLIPKIKKLAQYLETSNKSHSTDPHYLRASKSCTTTGWFLFAIPIAITLLNVLKPGAR
jgi:uncharacterized membrane protein